jgi:hypothetical protein
MSQDQSSNPVPERRGGFAPGESGNPGGRPKGRSITAHLRKEMEGLDPTDPEGRTRIARIVDKLYILAIYGEGRDSLAAIQEILNRVDGKVKDELEHTIQRIAVVYGEGSGLVRNHDQSAEAAPGTGADPS